ncbi:MAG: pyridoxal 5'-phosphate synthase, partial [Pseudaminobacter sp.]
MHELNAADGDFTQSSEPFRLFAEWLGDAGKSEPNDPNAVALATVDAQGLPDVRMVLLKDFDERGFVFYTNFESAKGREILGSMKAAMCFHWKSLRRQVRVRGPVEIVSDEEADAYYATRPRGSR